MIEHHVANVTGSCRYSSSSHSNLSVFSSMPGLHAAISLMPLQAIAKPDHHRLQMHCCCIGSTRALALRIRQKKLSVPVKESGMSPENANYIIRQMSVYPGGVHSQFPGHRETGRANRRRRRNEERPQCHQPALVRIWCAYHVVSSRGDGCHFSIQGDSNNAQCRSFVAMSDQSSGEEISSCIVVSKSGVDCALVAARVPASMLGLRMSALRLAPPAADF